MKNKQVYKNVYRLSQKLRHQIDQLKQKVKDDDMQSSPTETMIAYDDEWKGIIRAFFLLLIMQ